MRRRTFLTATAAAGTLSALAACSGSNSPVSTPSPSFGVTPSSRPSPTPSGAYKHSPPNAAAVPSSFASQPRWPNFGTAGSITALRENYLCGSAGPEAEDEVRRTFLGHCPVVAELENLTTWAVLPDDDGTWSTSTVRSADSFTAPETAGSLSTLPSSRYMLLTGPALLDETYAYLTIGILDDTQISADYGLAHTLCRVDLVKVALSDGAVAASTTLSNNFIADSIEKTRTFALSFSEDRSALLIAGDNEDQELDPNGIGLRLSATDLSVQFDATTVLTEPSSYRRQCGEALAAGRGNNNVIVYLADGTIEPLADTTDMLVRDGWIYYHDRTDHADHARNLRTGETITISDTGGYIDYLDDRTENRVQTDQHEVILGSGKMGSSASFSVRRPGEAEPLLSWKTEERKIPEAACVFGNVLYTTGQMDPDGKVQLTSLPSGDDLGEIPDIGKDSYESFAVQSFAVSAWGLASGGRFYPAFKWFDS